MTSKLTQFKTARYKPNRRLELGSFQFFNIIALKYFGLLSRIDINACASPGGLRLASF